MIGGINRYDREAKPEQAVEARDVIADDGELRRRDAMVSIQRAAPFMLPVGSVIVRSAPLVGPTVTDADRIPTNWSGFYIGCREAFDGIAWGPITDAIVESAENYDILVWFGDGGEDATEELATGDPSNPTETLPPLTSWSLMSWWKDSTRQRFPTNEYAEPLKRTGSISWHRSSPVLETWTKRALDGIGAWWVWVQLINAETRDPVESGIPELVSPGIRAFKYAPVNGLFPVRLRGGGYSLVIGSDRRERRGSEAGALLASARGYGEDALPLAIVEDEGAGLWGEYTYPGWVKDSGAATVVGAYAASRGATGDLSKNDESYRWVVPPPGTEPPISQWRGAPKITNMAVDLGEDITTTSACFPDLVDVEEDLYENLRLRVIDKGGAGPQVGEEVEITLHTPGSGFMAWSPALSEVPDADTRFAITGRHARVRVQDPPLVEGVRPTEDFEISENEEHIIRPTRGRAHESDPDDWMEEPLHHFFEVAHEMRWTIGAGYRWSGCVDTVRGRLILTNGESGLLAYDGRRLRRLEADRTSSTVRRLIGATPSNSPDNTIAPQLAKGLLRLAPPDGRYVVDYRGRIVVGHLRGRPRDVAWSFPGIANNAWPNTYQSQILDSDNLPISGLATLGDKLVVFTPTSIHEGVVTDQGLIGFRPVAHGVGATAHAAIAQVAIKTGAALIFPSVDGVSLWNGSEPEELVDGWDRLVDGGINPEMLHLAVGCVLPNLKLYCLAVASAGSSNALDTILVFDYSRRSWWPWSAPFGVSSLARDVGHRGQERLLIGTDDGHVATLLPQQKDDGETITGYARTPPIAPFGDMRADFTRLMVEAVQLGAAGVGTGNRLAIATYVNRRDAHNQLGFLELDGGGMVFASRDSPGAGDAELGDADNPADEDPTLAGNERKVVPLNLLVGTAGHTFAIKVTGASRWRFRGATVEARALERHSR
jgi:hypothetical protein